MFLLTLPARHQKFVPTSDWADNVTVTLSSLLLHSLQQDISQNSCFQEPAVSGMTYLQISATCRFAAVFPWSISQVKCQGNRIDDVAHLSISEKMTGRTAAISQHEMGNCMEDPCFLLLISSPICHQGKAVPLSLEDAGRDVLLSVCCTCYSAMCMSCLKISGPALSAHIQCPRLTTATGCGAAWKEGAS